MSDDARPVRAHLDGAERDFQTISRFFAGAATGVEQQNDGGWVLFGPELESAWAGDGARLHEVTVELVRDINGVARAVDAGHRPIRAIGRYDGPGNTVHVIGPASVTVMVSASMLVIESNGGTPAPPEGPPLLAKVQQHPQLAEALHLLGGADQLSWYDLWKVFEVVREACGGWNGLVALGITEDELRSFKRSANDPSISKDQARHARMSQQSTPADPMDLPEARQLMSRIVRSWSDTL